MTLMNSNPNSTFSVSYAKNEEQWFHTQITLSSKRNNDSTLSPCHPNEITVPQYHPAIQTSVLRPSHASFWREIAEASHKYVPFQPILADIDQTPQNVSTPRRFLKCRPPKAHVSALDRYVNCDVASVDLWLVPCAKNLPGDRGVKSSQMR